MVNVTLRGLSSGVVESRVTNSTRDSLEELKRELWMTGTNSVIGLRQYGLEVVTEDTESLPFGSRSVIGLLE